jgi:hypothetical protein
MSRAAAEQAASKQVKFLSYGVRPRYYTLVEHLQHPLQREMPAATRSGEQGAVDQEPAAEDGFGFANKSRNSDLPIPPSTRARTFPSASVLIVVGVVPMGPLPYCFARDYRDQPLFLATARRLSLLPVPVEGEGDKQSGNVDSPRNETIDLC